MNIAKTLTGMVVVCALSCTTLDTEPLDFTAPEFYYNTEKELEHALNGIYDVLANHNLYGGGNGLITILDCADEMYFRSAATARGPWSYVYSAAESWPTVTWQTLYRGIERANMLLANIEKPEMDDDRRAMIKGEAKFLRAFFYFVLVQNYGDVPLKTVPTASVSDVNIARTPLRNVYDFVYQEMLEAEQDVRPIASVTYAGRVTKSAVQGLLARVSLYRAGFPNYDKSGFQDALFWSEKLIHSGYHQLNPDYAQVFINLIQDKYDLKESIWEVEYFTTGITDPHEVSAIGNNNGISQEILEYGYATGQYRVHDALYRKYEADDVRRDWAIAPFWYRTNSNPPEKVYWTEAEIYNRNIGKYRREYELIADKHKNTNGTNFPLLRYADVLLMAAEAENEVNGATEKALFYLNQVRRRANASELGSLDQSSLRKVIRDERSRELCFEGWRRLDLIRWGIFIPVMKELQAFIEQTAPTAVVAHATAAARNVNEMHLYFPIPLRELSLNKSLTQNPGW